VSINSLPEPFFVKDCALVTIATGKKAQNLKEMRDHLSAIHLGSIYHHFWGGLLRPKFDEPEYNNDFAEWVHHAFSDDILAERLSVIDPDRSVNLEALRQELLEVIERRLDSIETIVWSKLDMQFHFVRSQIVVFDTLCQVEEPSQLAEAAGKMSVGSIFYHFIDARRRSPEMMDDFRTWLKSYGEDELASQVAKVDPYFRSLAELRRQLTDLFAKYYSKEVIG
jgi:septum formation topological specificity factor MinE